MFKTRLLVKLKKKFLKRYQKLRILFYKLISDENYPINTSSIKQPLLIQGPGRIELAPNVELGVNKSPYYFNGYNYISLRNRNSLLRIGYNTKINNNFCVICESEGVEIGENSLIGFEVKIFDSDFHAPHFEDRKNKLPPNRAKVKIGNNVFIGSNVTILKGVTIGDDTVIASNSLVVKSLPARVLAGGNPAKVIKNFEIH